MVNVRPEDAQSGAESGYPRIGLFIDGQWTYDSEASIEIRNPSDERIIGHAPRASGIKESGIGREGGNTSLDAYTVSKTVLQSTVRV